MRDMDHKYSLLRQTPALKALSDLAKGVVDTRRHGCNAAAVATALALELFHFLQAKRHLALSDAAAALQVSPGSLVDALWHRMLLQSDVREAVDALLGGHVPHSLRDADELSDGDKLARRLTAMNLMALAGWQPTLEFWREAGTLMDDVVAVSAGGVTVYVAPRMSRTAAFEVTGRFLDQLGIGLNGASALVAALAAVAPPAPAAAPPHAAPPTRAGRPKRQRAADAEAAEALAEGDDCMQVTVVDGPSARQLLLRLPRDGGMVVHIIAGIQEAWGTPPGLMRLIFRGKQLYDEYAKLSQCGIEDGARISLVLRLLGC